MKYFFIILTLFFTLLTNAIASPDPIPANEAFQFSATAKNYQTILLTWKLAPNYYLYQKHFSFRVLKPADVKLGDPLFPNDTQTLKTILGTFLVYSNSVTIPVPIINATEKSLILQVKYQGCSKFGYCYPPITKIVPINLSGNFMQPSSGLNIDVAPTAFTSDTLSPKNSRDPFSSLLNHRSLLLIILGFLGFGVLLSLTPCVLPMIPILSSMILGREKMSHAHAFLLSLFYVLGMAITYACAGIIVGILGSNIQIIFQQPWIIICFVLLFITMALSLFGLYQIQLPEKLRSKIASTSHHQKSGTYIGAFVMGILSTLILSPCVTPPLVAALGIISQKGSALEGGAALFAMGIGMGAPLLLIGALGPKILPKSGAWMNTIKNVMGIMLLAVAILMLQRVVSASITMALWAALSIGTAIYLGALSTAESPAMMIKKSIGLLFFIYGILLMVGLYHGNENPLSVLKTSSQQRDSTAPQFQLVQSIEELHQALALADKTNQPVLLDFYADWCIACKEFDAYTLKDPQVKEQLAHFLLLRVDITKNTPDDQLLMKQYNVIAPPTVVFLHQNAEIPNTRMVGFEPAEKFLKKLLVITRSNKKLHRNHP